MRLSTVVTVITLIIRTPYLFVHPPFPTLTSIMKLERYMCKGIIHQSWAKCGSMMINTGLARGRLYQRALKKLSQVENIDRIQTFLPHNRYMYFTRSARAANTNWTKKCGQHIQEYHCIIYTSCVKQKKKKLVASYRPRATEWYWWMCVTQEEPSSTQNSCSAVLPALLATTWLHPQQKAETIRSLE